MRGYDDMSVLGEYFAEFNRGDLSATPAGPKLDLGDEISVLDVQKYLNRRGYRGSNKKALKEDGKWGQNTEFALKQYLAAYNKTNNAAAAYDTLGVGRLIITGGAGKVMLAALRLQGSTPMPAVVTKPSSTRKTVRAATPSKVKATEPSKAGMVQVPIAKVQAVLQSNGLKIKPDGAWGPTTQRLWQALASKRGQDVTINRAGPDSAWVVPQTLSALETPATQAARATTVSADTTVSIASLQKILQARGITSFGKADGKYGPKTAAAWSAAATAQGLSPAISRVSGLTAKVARATYDALRATPTASTGVVPVTNPVRVPTASTPSVPTAPVAPPQMRPASTASTVAVLITVVQKAWNEVVKSNPAAGKELVVNGKWSTSTAQALSKMTGLTALAANKLVNKKKTAVSLSPTLAEQLGTLAQGSPEIAKAVEVLAARWDAGRAQAAQQEQAQTQARTQAPQTQAQAPQTQAQAYAQPQQQQQQEQTFAPVLPAPSAPMQEEYAPAAQAPMPPQMPEATPPTQEIQPAAQAPATESGGGSNTALIFGGVAVAASLLYLATRKG